MPLKASVIDPTVLKKLDLDENDLTAVVTIFMFPDPEVPKCLCKLGHQTLQGSKYYTRVKMM